MTASAALASLLLVAMACGCSKKIPPQQKIALPVITDAVAAKDFPVFVDTFGSLKSLTDVNIKSQVSGKIMEAKFTEGQFVNAGDTLFVIDKVPYQAAYDAAQGTLAFDMANYEYSKYLVDANKTLANTSALARQTYEQYVHNAAATSGRVASDKAALKTAAINLGWCEIKAPFSGITGKQLVDPGNIVSTVDNPTLVNIASIDPIYADFTVPEKYFSKVNELMRAGQLKIQANPQGSANIYEGVVSMIDNKVDDMNGTLSVRATIPNPERKLWPGQFVNIKLVFSIMKDAMVVPVDAVQSGSAGPYVFAMRDGKAVMVNVTTGQGDADVVVILKGDIKPGDRVIKVGTMLLSPGADVIEAQLANAAFAQQMAAMMAAKQGQKPPAAAGKPDEKMMASQPSQEAQKPADKPEEKKQAR